MPGGAGGWSDASTSPGTDRRPEETRGTRGRFFPRHCTGSTALLTLCFGTSGLQNWGSEVPSFGATQFLALGCGGAQHPRRVGSPERVCTGPGTPYTQPAPTQPARSPKNETQKDAKEHAPQRCLMAN